MQLDFGSVGYGAAIKSTLSFIFFFVALSFSSPLFIISIISCDTSAFLAFLGANFSLQYYLILNSYIFYQKLERILTFWGFIKTIVSPQFILMKKTCHLYEPWTITFRAASFNFGSSFLPKCLVFLIISIQRA